MSGRKKRKLKKHSEGSFFALPHRLLNGQKYAKLSSNAIKLLIDIGVQYNGYNNGFLKASFNELKSKGWRSKTTLSRCILELEEVGFIIRMRQGCYPNIASLYALTWKEISSGRNTVCFDVGAKQYVGKTVGYWRDHICPKSGLT